MEVVGKHGQVTAEKYRFSNLPELHSHDLENLPVSQVSDLAIFKHVFHFCLGNYGYYWLFI